MNVINTLTLTPSAQRVVLEPPHGLSVLSRTRHHRSHKADMTLCVWATLIRSTEQRKRQSCLLAGSGRVVRYDGFVLLDGLG